MKKSLSSEAAERLCDYALSETTQGRVICATDYPFSPEDFPEGEQREIAQGISKLQEEGFFDHAQEGRVKEASALSPHHEISEQRPHPSQSKDR